MKQDSTRKERTHAKGGFGFKLTCSSVRISPAKSAEQCSNGDTPGIFLSPSSRRRDVCLSDQIANAEALRRRGARAARNFIVLGFVSLLLLLLYYSSCWYEGVCEDR